MLKRILMIVVLACAASAAQADNLKQCLTKCDGARQVCRKPVIDDQNNQYRQCNGVWRTGVQRCNEQYSKPEDKSARERCIDYRDQQRESCEKNARKNARPDFQKCDRKDVKCREDCQNTYGEAGSDNGEAGYRIEPCPPGTRVNVLGTCDAIFKVKEQTPGEGGCAPGHIPGPYGDCVPKIAVKVVPVPDGYVIACPKGMKPSPIDGGCVVNDVNPDDDRQAGDGRVCPPGSAPGPDDGDCVPVLPRFSTSPSLQWLMAQIADTRSLARSPQRFSPAELNRQLIAVTDIGAALERTAEAMDMEWERAAE